MQPLKMLARTVVEDLATKIPANLDRYSSSDFQDLQIQSGWAIEIDKVLLDRDLLASLKTEASTEAEVANSLLIYKALPGMTPAMARDERIWSRLCHVECLEYVRARWLKAGSTESRVRAHFFAPSLPGCRDDNALGRLWWNAHIATLAKPDDIELALSRLLSRANVRLQIIDRADTAFRQPLISGIVRLLADPWFQTDDAAVADFMYQVNKASGGIVFEALTTDQVDRHLAFCLELAKLRLDGRLRG